MSDTPRTDAEAKKWAMEYDPHYECVPADFARCLERELSVMSELYAKEAHAKMVLMEHYSDGGRR